MDCFAGCFPSTAPQPCQKKRAAEQSTPASVPCSTKHHADQAINADEVPSAVLAPSSIAAAQREDPIAELAALLKAREAPVAPAGSQSEARNCGPYEGLRSLRTEFKFNEQFGKLVDALERQGYQGWRRIRGDGNCFYRALGVGLLEVMIMAPRALQMAWASSFLEKLKVLSFRCPMESQAHQLLLAHMSCLAAGCGWQESEGGLTQLELLHLSVEDTSHASLDLALVRALRSLASRYLRDSADEPATPGGLSFRQILAAQGSTPEAFCRSIIDKMGTEAEGLVMNAIVPAVGADLQIVFIDPAQDSLSFQDYEAGAGGNKRPMVQVQHRPGHYDLIYTRPPMVADATHLPATAERTSCSACERLQRELDAERSRSRELEKQLEEQVSWDAAQIQEKSDRAMQYQEQVKALERQLAEGHQVVKLALDEVAALQAELQEAVRARGRTEEEHHSTAEQLSRSQHRNSVLHARCQELQAALASQQPEGAAATPARDNAAAQERRRGGLRSALKVFG